MCPSPHLPRPLPHALATGTCTPTKQRGAHQFLVPEENPSNARLNSRARCPNVIVCLPARSAGVKCSWSRADRHPVAPAVGTVVRPVRDVKALTAHPDRPGPRPGTCSSSAAKGVTFRNRAVQNERKPARDGPVENAGAAGSAEEAYARRQRRQNARSAMTFLQISSG